MSREDWYNKIEELTQDETNVDFLIEVYNRYFDNMGECEIFEMCDLDYYIEVLNKNNTTIPKLLQEAKEDGSFNEGHIYFTFTTDGFISFATIKELYNYFDEISTSLIEYAIEEGWWEFYFSERYY